MDACVVEHAVQKHPHAALMGLPYQSCEFLLGSEIRVDGKVIGGGVLVVEIPGKDRRKIETVHAKLLKVRQLLTDARQIASKVVLPRGRGIPRVQRMGMRRRATAGEAFGKDLVVYRAHGPFGRRDHITRIDLKQLEEACIWLCVRNAVLTVETFLA